MELSQANEALERLTPKRGWKSSSVTDFHSLVKGPVGNSDTGAAKARVSEPSSFFLPLIIPCDIPSEEVLQGVGPWVTLGHMESSAEGI